MDKTAEERQLRQQQFDENEMQLTGMRVVAIGSTVSSIHRTTNHGRVTDVVIDTKAVVVVIAVVALIGGGTSRNSRWRTGRAVTFALGVHQQEAGDAVAAAVVVGHFVVVLAEETVVTQGELVTRHQLTVTGRAAEALDVVDLRFGSHHKIRAAET